MYIQMVYYTRHDVLNWNSAHCFIFQATFSVFNENKREGVDYIVGKLVAIYTYIYTCTSKL